MIISTPVPQLAASGPRAALLEEVASLSASVQQLASVLCELLLLRSILRCQVRVQRYLTLLILQPFTAGRHGVLPVEDGDTAAGDHCHAPQPHR